MAREVFVLGVDPGFASFGVSIVELTASTERVRMTEVIRTKKSTKKQNVRAADDNFRRAGAIAAVLHDVVATWKPMAIAAEAMSFPRNASAAAKVAMAWGILADIAEVYSLPMVQATPQEIKRALCDKETATKVEVRDRLQTLYEGQFDQFTSGTPEGQWEHGFDATGAVIACLDSDIVRMARGMVE